MATNKPQGGKPVCVYGSYGRDGNGKRVRKKFVGNTLSEALMKRELYERERQMGVPDFSETITVAEWVDMWQDAYKAELHGTNKVSYKTYTNRLLEDLGTMRMANVRNIHLQRSMMKMAGKSQSSTVKYRMVLQQIFKKARQNKVIRDDPAESLELPDPKKRIGHRALTREETKLITEHWQEHRAGIWMMVMLYAGLRRSEMIALDWDSVDLEARTINVHRSAEIIVNQATIKEMTKTEAGQRIIPISRPLLRAMEAVPAKDRNGLVCKSANGQCISQSAFDRGLDGFNLAMARILNGEPVIQRGRRRDREKPLPDGTVPVWIPFSIRAHDLRYSFATALYDAGVDVKSAQYYLGHSDVRTTMNIYTQLSEERKNLARSQMISFLDGWINEPSAQEAHADPEP